MKHPSELLHQHANQKMDRRPGHQTTIFNGDQKHLDHWLLSAEKIVIATLLPRVPLWMSTTHLTLMTIFWSAGVILFGYLANYNLLWLWGFSFCVMFQHITDMLDGAVGRSRNEGLIKWGFYADHFLDYVFLCAIVVGYAFLLPLFYWPLVILHLIVCAGFMVHVFLDFAITNDFKISFNHLGVSELRWAVIILNLVVMMVGHWLLVILFPFIVLISTSALLIMVYRSQKYYWHMDMKNKQRDGFKKMPASYK